MTRLLVSFLALSLLGIPARAHAEPQASPLVAGAPDPVRQITDLELQAKEAAITRDVTFAERTLADDYVAVTPLGQVVTRADTLEARKRSQVHYDSIHITDMKVRVYGNTAIVTARAEVKGNDLGEDFSGPYRFTRVWVRRNGRWQAVSYQATVTR
jgi:ketosteroid isomerase-like protein